MLTAIATWARRRRAPERDRTAGERATAGSRLLVIGACEAALEQTVDELVAPSARHEVSELVIAAVATTYHPAVLVAFMGGVPPSGLAAPEALEKAAETARRIAAAVPQTLLVRHLACDGSRPDALLHHVRSGRVDCVVAADRSLGPGAWGALKGAAESARVPLVLAGATLGAGRPPGASAHHDG